MIKKFSPADFSDIKDAAEVENRRPATNQFTLAGLLSLRRAATEEFEVSEKEAQKIRRLIYSVNKNHPKGYRFRTLREDGILVIWRIR